jgi:hypothetical protein
MSAPLPGEAIAVDAGGSDAAFVGRFVARRLDGSWILARGGDSVVTIPATEDERASALPLPKRIPKVRLEEIPSWENAAASTLFGGGAPLGRPQLIVTVSSTKRRFKKLVTTVKVRRDSSLPLCAFVCSHNILRGASLLLSHFVTPAAGADGHLHDAHTHPAGWVRGRRALAHNGPHCSPRDGSESACGRRVADSAGACSFIYRYILRKSCSQFDSLPLTSLTISLLDNVVPCRSHWTTVRRGQR